LTIHKSKGLEFDHVFIPYLDWSIQPQTSAEKAPLLWCKADKKPFNDIDVLPVRYKSDVGKSVFYREYFFEKFNTFIDNLNLMYVAFTRAKKGLYIWASYTGKFSTVGDLLKLSAEQILLNPNQELGADKIVDFAKNYDNEKNLLIIGNQEYIEDDKSSRGHLKSVQIEKLEFVDFRKFLQIKKNGEDFFSRENKRQTSINKGKIIHEILSGVKLIDDLPKAVKKMETDGKIEKNDVLPLISELNKLLSKQETRHWFDGTYKILTERNILTGPKGIKRPDRIMVGDNETIVIDYKSGDSESDKYKYQLHSYITELTKCGFENVSGFIWYTRLNKLVRI
jgi:CRISPR/Cas system-associated exonuclease Cas4 (RecB family)